jgi:hypothetical protein
MKDHVADRGFSLDTPDSGFLYIKIDLTVRSTQKSAIQNTIYILVKVFWLADYSINSIFIFHEMYMNLSNSTYNLLKIYILKNDNIYSILFFIQTATVIKLYAFKMLLFELFPLQRTNGFPFNARTTERIKNLSIISLKFIDNWTPCCSLRETVRSTTLSKLSRMKIFCAIANNQSKAKFDFDDDIF